MELTELRKILCKEGFILIIYMGITFLFQVNKIFTATLCFIITLLLIRDSGTRSYYLFRRGLGFKDGEIMHNACFEYHTALRMKIFLLTVVIISIPIAWQLTINSGSVDDFIAICKYLVPTFIVIVIAMYKDMVLEEYKVKELKHKNGKDNKNAG